MKIFIRNAQVEDFEAIADLSNQMGYESDRLEVQKRLDDILEHGDNCVFVALNGERFVGWVHGFYTRRIESGPFIEIGGLVVDNAYRRKGIGKLLIAEVNTWSIEKECRKIRVKCNATRKEGNRFYQAIGFDLNKVQNVYERNQQ